MDEQKMKTPLTFYGGKQTLASLIISLIPDHILYGEPFTGGGAAFFHKPPSKSEVLNDVNGELMNFYKVCRDKFRPLQKLVQQTLHSRNAFRQAEVVYHNPDLFDDVRRAWAVWTICAMSFSSKLNSPYGFDKTNNTTSKKVASKRSGFIKAYAERLERVQIEHADALYIIRSRDHEGAFFYCDPPYVGSDCGHYKGYTEADFEALLRLLSAIKGKFLLSSYPSNLLERYIKKFKWSSISRELFVTVNLKGGNPKRKTELLTANYPLEI
ncbi:DNA adenine methylase [Dinghuibacter silviterrae]|uniref:DNA adenine methylase n=1 Tax=Dinghuibacter silviterrae TaxID=1539049 RepID=A0A4R8DRT1_9BACT|nr:DNA adenine methylase [Dinghuibacter silviterrae]TDX00518.1 DNA adenine methylase [Dinghuibacter silviterrae]